MSLPDQPGGGRPKGSEEPLPGHCGAKLRGTDPPRYCLQYPLPNGTGRCRIHGGLSDGSGTLIHGRFSKRFKNLSEQGQALLQELMDDPDLLDQRRQIAAAEMVSHQMPLDIDDALAETFARLGLEGDAVLSSADVELARAEIGSELIKQSAVIARMKNQAMRDLRLDELLRGQVVPFFRALAAQLDRLLEHHFPDGATVTAKGKEDLKLELAGAMHAALAQITSAVQKAAKAQ